MSSGWYYDSPSTVAGALQRGLGRGAALVRDPDDVMACVRRDYRFWWVFDDRALYLARLVRDLRIDTGRVVDVLRAEDDDDNAVSNSTQVLVQLGRGGDPVAVDGVREYVRHGADWVDALEEIAAAWPAELWDDLLPVAADRLRPEDVIGWARRPWTDWTARDDRVAVAITACRPPDRQCPWRGDSAGDLLAKVRTGTVEERRHALRHLRRHGPQPALLDLVATLPVEELHRPLGNALSELGAAAVPVAREWAARLPHQIGWTGCRLLAEHGDESDGPALLAGWTWLDGRADLCGYDQLAAGLARIGGDAARTAVPKLRRAWFTPHSYERAATLKAFTALDPDAATRQLTEGLWDCEADVREFAAARAPLSPAVEHRLAVLRDDPLETPEVRAAATTRLAS
ncbi:hypothetical protein [Dactylosporangium sp. NPDC000521]|uniref:hypothetical protein n=1 Tax=Dactylosporangium sp. NPDC000521 TaxID=3363975 RepID=UPI0036737D5B